MIHVSEVLDLPVVDADHQRLGRVDDLVVDSAQGTVERLLVRRGDAKTVLPWTQVAALSPEQGRVVLVEGASPMPLEGNGTEGEALRLRRDVLDRQIIDIARAARSSG